MKANIIKKKFLIKKNKIKLYIEPIEVDHGLIKSTGYCFDDIAYISDCNKISNAASKKLKNLKYLIIDCLRKEKHPSHFSFDDAMDFIDFIKPKKAPVSGVTKVTEAVPLGQFISGSDVFSACVKILILSF